MLYIAGKWKDASGDSLASINPANEEVVWQGRGATADEVSAAFESASQALPSWKRLTVENRGEILKRFATLVLENADSLAKTISDEVGKTMSDAHGEVKAVAGKCNLTLQAYEERRDQSQITTATLSGRVAYRPLGVVSVFGPFNFPAHIANGQIMPALLAGNCLVFKPSDLTPLVAERMVRLWEEAGLPPGVLNLIQGGVKTGQAVLEQPQLRGLFFTGSRATGIRLREALASRLEVLLALELGGNNPLIVHKPSDRDAAVESVIRSAFLSSGQRCTCARRLIVTGDSDSFLELLVERAGKLVVGKPTDEPEPFMGPLVTSGAVDRLLKQQSRLCSIGGVPLLSSERLSLGSAFVSPGIIDVTGCQTRDDEEVFGPFLQVIRAGDLEAAIQEANNTQYGLAAGILCDDRADFDRFRQDVNAGLLNWNLPTTGASGRMPFGGVGQSGNYRPAGFHAIDFCHVAIAETEAVDQGESTK